MSTNRRVARLAAAAVAAALLALAACQGEPDPIPTATLPTPVTPTPSAPPSSSSSPSSSLSPDLNDAMTAYFEGRAFSDQLFVDGYDEDDVKKLDEFYSGDYRDFLENGLRQYEREAYDQTGVPDLATVLTDDEAEADVTEGRVTLTACVDFTPTSVKDREGNVIDSGFSYSVDQVEMIRTDRWRADSINSEPMDSFEGSECEGVGS